MQTKKCTKCNIEKSLFEFTLNNSHKDKLTYWCKSCLKNWQQEHYKLYPWKRTFDKIKQRCEEKNNNRYYCYGAKGIKCLITVEELKELWFKDKAYEMKKPTIDRKDNNGHYTFNNCQYLENADNVRKAQSIEIFQYDLEGNFIKEWESLTIASYYSNISIKSISNVLRKSAKTAGGFIWKYKGEIKC